MADDAALRPLPTGRGPRGRPSAAQRTGPLPAAVLEQAFDRSSLDVLRAAVAAHAVLAGVAHDRADDLVLVAHELAANAVLHGAGHGQLRAWRHGQALYCEVTDDGPPTAGAPAPPPAAASPGAGPVPPERAWWPAEHGHGLWVVSQLTDQASLRRSPGGTTAAVRLPLPPAGR